jgi:EPS-associated MarR family transcriptional regulator
VTNRKARLQEDHHFWVLRRLQEKPDITQRELANELGISLGGVNYCLKGLVEKGWVKMQNFSRSENKMHYAYLLTPTGVAGKTLLTTRFLKRKMQEYEDLRTEIEALKEEVSQSPEAEK